MVSVNRILCPVDLSELFRHALDHATVLAQWYGGHITVLHVFELPQPVMPVSGVLGDVPVIPPIRPEEDIVEDVRRFCGALIGAGQTPEIVVKAGAPAKEIVQHADTMSADLLVMGTHGREGFERLVLGSVTEKVLRTTRRPVLTVPPPVNRVGDTPLYKTILCPLDFSAASTRALEFALALAKESDARLILLHVLEGFLEPGELDEHAHFTVPEYRQYIEKDAMGRLKAAVPDAARVRCKPEERLTSGKAYREILRTAAETNVQLIVMGVHGRNPLSTWLFGSTTQHVIRHATCPVLTLRG